jgi:hypothetical protein
MDIIVTRLNIIVYNTVRVTDEAKKPSCNSNSELWGPA